MKKSATQSFLRSGRFASFAKFLLVGIFLISQLGAIAQQKTITGNITGDDGAPLPGVTIVIKGTTTGTISDVDGNYTLPNVPADATIVYSFVGMKTQEIVVGNQTAINITMETDAIGLEEVIAVGYGTMRKSDLTGSVARVSFEDKSLQSNLNILQTLSGASAGINVQQTGAAGGEPDFSIRGKTSLSASDKPLIVLDGIIYNGAIADINVSDVKSVDILKDASAAAVYGSRSANGVILITTKQGNSEKPQINFNMYYGFQNITNTPMKVMNAEQYAIRLTDYYYQQNLYTWYRTNPTSDAGKPARPDVTDRNVVASTLRTQEEKDNYLAGNEIDWVDEVLQTAPIQNYNLSYSGKTSRTNYYVSGSYANEEGVLQNDKFSRFTLRTNIESDINDWLTLGINSAYSYRDYSGLPASLNEARECSPLADNKIGQPDYDMFLTGEAYMEYPLVDLYADNSDIRNNLFMVGSAQIEIPWIEGLSLDINYSNTFNTRNNFSFWPTTHPDGAGNKGRGRKDHIEQRSWIQNNILRYLRSFGDHNVNATFLYSREHSQQNTSRLQAEGFENQGLGYNGLGLGTISTVSTTENGGTWAEDGISYMGRVSYSYKNRYYLTGTVRRDGYSGFGANNKFANFPSVSVGWVLSEESFASGNNFPYLKIRTSYGINGNQGLGRYKSFSTMDTRSYVYGAETSIGVYPSGSLGNDDLKWEKTASLNLGVDFAFMDQRISGSLDLYNANTTDVLVERALPATAGYENVFTNIGGINNKGIEVTLNTNNMQRSDFKWTSNFTFSLNRNEITKLYGDENDADIGNEWFVGESISAQYDYEMAGGVWTEEELYSGQILNGWYPGQFRYVDQNDDGVIESTNDRKVIGYEDPNFRFSINNSMSYKNFTLNFLFNSITGGNGYYIMDNTSVLNTNFRSDNVYRMNMSAVRPYWTPDNGVNNATGIYNSPAVTSGVYQSRGFIRLQDLSLSYKFDNSVINRLKLNNLQVYVSGKNLYTWTKWSGWDPETGTSNTPLMRSFTVGLKLAL
jgi:TonB-linked SusC/RagA family outer membrane protein